MTLRAAQTTEKIALTSLRLIFPLWLGGNNPVYEFGAKMLAWLAPEASSPVVRVPVAPTSEKYGPESGIHARRQVNRELDSAQHIIQLQNPDRITTLGGDCLADLVPFAWLSNHYKQEKFGVLWIDAHPDVMTPQQYENSHAHVLGALMGNGDNDFTSRVKTPVPASRILIAGINEPTDYEAAFIKEYGIATASPDQVRTGNSGIKQWIESEGITHLAIHFDLDVLDYHKFRSVLFAQPDGSSFDGIAKGKLMINDVLSIVAEAEASAKVVGLGITEHLPWDAMNLKNMLSKLPLLRDGC